MAEGLNLLSMSKLSHKISLNPKQPRFLHCLWIHIKLEVPSSSYIAHFLSEIKEAEVARKRQSY